MHKEKKEIFMEMKYTYNFASEYWYEQVYTKWSEKLAFLLSTFKVGDCYPPLSCPQMSHTFKTDKGRCKTMRYHNTDMQIYIWATNIFCCVLSPHALKAGDNRVLYI